MKKNTLKLWIGIFFFGLVLMLIEVIKGIYVNPTYLIFAFIMFVFCYTIWKLKINESFLEMYEDYIKAGSLKQTVKNWKEGGEEK